MNNVLKKAFRVPLLVIVFNLALTACAAATPAAQPAVEQGGVVAPASAPEIKRAANTTSDSTTSSEVTASLVVRHANLTLIVQDTQAQVDAIVRLATDMKGYVATSSTTRYDVGLQAKITLRVPSEQFDATLERLHKLAVEVREEQISGEDVTAEYTDLTSRLKNLEAAEEQLRLIMAKAEKTEDILAVFNQLTQIRGDIEQTKGRMQFLSQSAAMGTIEVTLIPDKLAQPLQVAGWRPEGVIKSAIEALVSALQGLATLAIWLVIVVLPVGLVLASPFILLYIILRRRSRRKLTAKT